jgi:Uma2 family endonuclease
MAEPIRKMPADWETASSSPNADPFFYGYRLRCVRLPSGEEVEQQIPLTPEDLLDPQPGDVVGQSQHHSELRFFLSGLLARHYASRKDVYVAVDMKMLWGIPGLPEPAPDIAVIQGVRENEYREDFDVVEEGARPCLIIEIVSSRDSETRRNDYERKVEIYQRVGIIGSDLAAIIGQSSRMQRDACCQRPRISSLAWRQMAGRFGLSTWPPASASLHRRKS